jgi:hypothetical protein
MEYIMNLQQRSDFYALLFGMWCASRRSKKIRNGLELCVEKPVSTIEKILYDGRETAQHTEECKEKARTLPKSVFARHYFRPDFNKDRIRESIDSLHNSLIIS